MHDQQLHTSVRECAYCAAPVIDQTAHEICWYRHTFYTCSERCKVIWRAILLGTRNIEAAE